MELSVRQCVPNAQHVSLNSMFELWQMAGPACEGSASCQGPVLQRTYGC